MAAPTFMPFRPPSPGTDDKPVFKILKADFGDGYTQWSADGLNNKRRVLTLTWEMLRPSEVKVFTTFFDALKGCGVFWYTPSDEFTPVKWTAEDGYNDLRGPGGLRKFTITIKQSFNLDV